MSEALNGTKAFIEGIFETALTEAIEEKRTRGISYGAVGSRTCFRVRSACIGASKAINDGLIDLRLGGRGSWIRNDDEAKAESELAAKFESVDFLFRVGFTEKMTRTAYEKVMKEELKRCNFERGELARMAENDERLHNEIREKEYFSSAKWAYIGVKAIREAYMEVAEAFANLAEDDEPYDALKDRLLDRKEDADL